MMSLVDICGNFPRVSYGNVKIGERNLVFAQMEDGSGYSWNLQVIINETKYDMYIRFDRMTRKAKSVLIDGRQCIETDWEWIA
jgi:hypothetical protein